MYFSHIHFPGSRQHVSMQPSLLAFHVSELVHFLIWSLGFLFPGILEALEMAEQFAGGRGRSVAPKTLLTGSLFFYAKYCAGSTRAKLKATRLPPGDISTADQVMKGKASLPCLYLMQHVADIIILTLTASSFTSLESLQCNLPVLHCSFRFQLQLVFLGTI